MHEFANCPIARGNVFIFIIRWAIKFSWPFALVVYLCILLTAVFFLAEAFLLDLSLAYILKHL